MHPNKLVPMKILRLGESDFSDSGLTDEEKKEYHTDLNAAVYGGFSFFVDSANPKIAGYVVSHDWQEAISCTCPDYVYRMNFCKHRKRVTLILLRRKIRLFTQALVFTQALAELAQALLEVPPQQAEVVVLSDHERVDKITSLNRPSGGGGFHMFK